MVGVETHSFMACIILFLVHITAAFITKYVIQGNLVALVDILKYYFGAFVMTHRLSQCTDFDTGV